MMKHYSILIFYLYLISEINGEENKNCRRPPELKVQEEHCWVAEVELMDRVVTQSRSVINFARKKLGMALEEEDNSKKCGYYVCLMRQLHLLTSSGYPSFEHILEWTRQNVIYYQAIELVKQLNKCNDALANATMHEINFYASQVDNLAGPSSKKEQSTCEIAAEFINCLARQNDCPVFVFP